MGDLEPHFFSSQAFELLADRESADRNARNSLIRLQANREMARRVADIAFSWPGLSGGVVTAAAVAGLDPQSPELGAIYGRDLESQAATMGVPTVPSGFLPQLGSAFKTGARVFLTALDAIYKEAVIGTTSFGVGLSQGMDIGEAAQRSYGYSPGAIALASQLQGRPVNLSTGLLPGGDIAPETEALVAQGVPFTQAIRNPAQLALGIPGYPYYEKAREESAVRVGADPNTGALGVPVTPGRVLASTFTEPGTTAFSMVSGLADIAANIWLDPAAAILKGAGAFRQGSQALVSQHVGLGASLVRHGRRPDVMAQTVAEFFAKPHGQRLAETLARETEYQPIWNQLQNVTKRHPDQSLALDLQRARDPEQVKAILTEAANSGVINRSFAPQTLTGRAVGSASLSGLMAEPFLPGARTLGLRQAIKHNTESGFVGKLFAEIGGDRIRPYEPDEAVFTLQQFMKVADFNNERTSFWMGEMAHELSTNLDDPYGGALRVMDDVMKELGERFTEAGYSSPVVAVMRRLFKEVEELRKYDINSAGGPQYGPPSPITWMDNGRAKIRPHPGILDTEYLSESIPLPDWRALRSTMRTLKKAENLGRPPTAHPLLHKYLGRFGVIEDWKDYEEPVLAQIMDSLVGGIWKPLVLARPAYTIRIGLEEQVRMAAGRLDSMFHHPFHYLTFLGARNPGTLLTPGKELDALSDFRSAMNNNLFRGGDRHARHPRYSENYITIPGREIDPITGEVVHPARAFDGMALTLEQHWNDRLSRAVARLGPDEAYRQLVGEVPPGAADELLTPLAERARSLEPNAYAANEGLRDLVDNMWVRMNHATGGHGWYLEPDTGNWVDDWGQVVDRRSAINRSIINDARPGQKFIVVEPGNAKLMDAINTRNLDGIDLTALTPANSSRFDNVIGHLRDNYADAIPERVKVALLEDQRLRKLQNGLWDRATDAVLGLFSRPLDQFDRSPAWLQFYWKRVGQLIAYADPVTQAEVLTIAASKGIKRPGLAGFLSRVMDPEDVALKKSVDYMADDFETFAARFGANPDPVFRGGGYEANAAGLPDLRTPEGGAAFDAWYTRYKVKFMADYGGWDPQAEKLWKVDYEANAIRQTIDKLRATYPENERALFDKVTDEIFGELDVDMPYSTIDTLSGFDEVSPGMGTHYHGNNGGLPGALDEIGAAEQSYGAQNMFGPAFYSSDAFEKSASYLNTKAAGNQHMYTLRWTGDSPPRVLNSDDILEPEAAEAIAAAFRSLNVFVDPRELVETERSLWALLADHEYQDLLRTVHLPEEPFAALDDLTAHLLPDEVLGPEGAAEMARALGRVTNGQVVPGGLDNWATMTRREVMEGIEEGTGDLAYGLDPYDLDVDDIYLAINKELRAAGYDAIHYPGGRMTGGSPHNAYAWIRPESLVTHEITNKVWFPTPPEASALIPKIAGDPMSGVAELEQIATAFALVETKRLLYSASKKHNLFDMARWFTPFGEAWFEIVSTWSRLIVENPAIIRRAEQVLLESKDQGILYNDPDSKEEVFNFPGAEMISQWMFGSPPPGDPTAQLQLTGRAQGLNLATSNLLPGVGFVLAIPASHWTSLNRDPQLRWLRDLVLPYGPTTEEPGPAGILDSFMPAWFKKVMISITGDGTADQDRLLANTTIDIYKTLKQNGQIDDSTPEGQRVGLEMSRRRARIVSLIRGVAQAVGPTGPSARFEVKFDSEADPDGALWTFQTLGTVYADLRNKHGGNDALAFDEFVQLFGTEIDPSSFATAKTTQVRPATMTQQGLDFQGSHTQLFKEFPLTAYFAQPDPEGNEDFDYGAYLAQLQDGTRVSRPPAVWLEYRNRLAGEIAYDHARQAITDPTTGKVNQSTEAKAYLRVVRDSLMEQFPGFGRDITGSINPADTAAIQAELEKWADDPFLSGTDAGRGLVAYQAARDQAIAIAASRGVTPAGTWTALSTQDLRDWLAIVAQSIAMTTGPDDGPNAAFVSLWDRAYAFEVEDPTHQYELMGQNIEIAP